MESAFGRSPQVERRAGVTSYRLGAETSWGSDGGCGPGGPACNNIGFSDVFRERPAPRIGCTFPRGDGGDSLEQPPAALTLRESAKF